MLELGIAQVQAQFTKLLNKTVVIIDKKSHIKKAVIIPYEEYMHLIKKSLPKENIDNGVFNKFAGVLDNELKTDDEKYNKVIN